MTDKSLEQTKAESLDNLTLRQRAGVSLDFIGQSIFPIGIGCTLGFFASDRGVRWLPTMVQAILLMCLLAILLMAIGWWLKGRVLSETAKGVRLRKRVISGIAISLAVLASQVVLYWQQGPSQLTDLSEGDFDRAFAIDAGMLQAHDAEMEKLLEAIKNERIFAEPGDRVLSSEKEEILRDSWASLHRLSQAQDKIRIFYEDYWRFDISRVERGYHLRSFLLTFAAELSVYEKAARFTQMVSVNPSAAKFLNGPHNKHNLPANTLSLFRQELLGTRDQARIIAGEKYLRIGLAKFFGAREEARRLNVEALWKDIDKRLRAVHDLGVLQRSALTIKADTQIFSRNVRRAWFPTQKEVAEIAGDTRVRRIGWYLIDEPLQAEMETKLEPGDILLTRKNWYLSNVGLPGFWPHAILYVGGSEKLTTYFDDPEVKAWLKDETGTDSSLPEHLERRWPGHWRQYQSGDHSGPYRVIEAISEGVVFNTLSHASGDYLVALRPRLNKVAKAQAIVEAFGHLDKPYDFNFDFATDHVLVCTELVWRSYRPRQGKDGIEIPLIKIAGRRTLPANEIACAFNRDRDSPERALDFVLFIDALEKDQRAFFSTEKAFLETCERPQWDTAQR